MDIYEAMKARHSVRQYLQEPIDDSLVAKLREEISKCNEESGMAIQLVLNEPKALSGLLAKYGNFKNAVNYIAMVAPKEGFERKVGYFGERLVLLATQLGLGTCWVAGTYRKVPSALKIEGNQKLHMIIAIGRGANCGKPHRSKSASDVSNISDDSPEWFKRGVEAALLAPTAINQQKFRFELDGEKVKASTRPGPYAETDLGIAELHFAIGAGQENFVFE